MKWKTTHHGTYTFSTMNFLGGRAFIEVVPEHMKGKRFKGKFTCNITLYHHGERASFVPRSDYPDLLHAQQRGEQMVRDYFKQTIDSLGADGPVEV